MSEPETPEPESETPDEGGERLDRFGWGESDLTEGASEDDKE